MMSFLSSESGKSAKKLVASKRIKDQWIEDSDWVPVDDEDCIGVRDNDTNIYIWPKRRHLDDYSA